MAVLACTPRPQVGLKFWPYGPRSPGLKFWPYGPAALQGGRLWLPWRGVIVAQWRRGTPKLPESTSSSTQWQCRSVAL